MVRTDDDLELLSFRDVARLIKRDRGAVAKMVAAGAIKSVPADPSNRASRRLVPRWALRDYQATLVTAHAPK